MLTRAIPILMLLGICGSALPTATNEEIEMQEPRPLARALFELSRRFGYLITYEEAPYDETAELFTTVYANGKRFRFPAWKAITFHISRPALTAAQTAEERLRDHASSAFSIAESMVAEYNSSGNPGRFAAIKDGGYVHVVPAGRLRNGRMETFQPILDTKVTFTGSQPRLCNDVVNGLLEQVNNLRGIHIVHNFPPNFLFLHSCTLEGTDITARDALKQLMRQMAVNEDTVDSITPHICTLGYDANEDLYFLTPELVEVPRPSGTPLQMTSPVQPRETTAVPEAPGDFFGRPTDTPGSQPTVSATAPKVRPNPEVRTPDH